MLCPATLWSVLVSVLSQELLGVTYSFDAGFDRTFTNKTCVANTEWQLIKYSKLNVTPIYKGSSGIMATEKSCTSSFLIEFFPDTTVELNVYVKVKTRYSGIQTTVVDANDNAVVVYSYNKTCDNYVPGWSTLLLPITKNVNGYINLKGSSRDDEIVVIDSLRYEANGQITSRTYSNNSILSANDESDYLLADNVQDDLDILIGYEGSGDDGSGEEDELGYFYEEIEEFDEDMDEKGRVIIED